MVKDLPGVGTGLVRHTTLCSAVLSSHFVISALQQDHIGTPVVFATPKTDSIHILQASILVLIIEFIKLIFLGIGAFLSPIPSFGIFARSRLLDEDSITVTKSPNGAEEFNPREPENLPDIEIMPLPGNAWETVDLKGKQYGAMTYLCVALRPEAAGTVRLQSVDPHEQPACDLGFLQSPKDFFVLRKAVKLALALSRVVRRQGYPLRNLNVPKSEGDQDLDDFIRANVKSTFHYSSSCRMAPEDEGGVVDDMLRVHGISGLRIADASVFPTIPATHLQAPTVMVGERCADFLAKEYNL